jgi:hypothetical protein
MINKKTLIRIVAIYVAQPETHATMNQPAVREAPQRGPKNYASSLPKHIENSIECRTHAAVKLNFTFAPRTAPVQARYSTLRLSIRSNPTKAVPFLELHVRATKSEIPEECADSIV